MSERHIRALEAAAGHLFAASLHMPTDWQRAKVREWADKAGKVAFASVGRNAKRQDRATGLGPKGEHAVGSEASETPEHSSYSSPEPEE